MNGRKGVSILGVFVADLAFRASRQPVIGETLFGSGFKMGPGGKGSNQSVAAARAGAAVAFISKIGRDAFGDIAHATWKQEGIAARVVQSDTAPTGAAYIFVSDVNGDNAIIVVPGAGAEMTVAELDASRDAITSSRVFVTQLEQTLEVARRGLEIAREAGVTTVFNPAPATSIPEDMYPLCDYVIPNESEAAMLTGLAVSTIDEARKTGDALLAKGVKTALITLGGRGSLLHSADMSEVIAPVNAGKVVETTGAGDSFVGAFATALADGMAPADAARFGSAAAGISVTRAGTAPSMPTRAEIERLLARG